MRCHYVYSKGARYHIPGCWGGMQDDTCTCPPEAAPRQAREACTDVVKAATLAVLEWSNAGPGAALPQDLDTAMQTLQDALYTLRAAESDEPRRPNPLRTVA